MFTLRVPCFPPAFPRDASQIFKVKHDLRMLETKRLAFGIRAGLVLVPLLAWVGCGGAEGQPFGGGGFLGRGGGASGSGGIVGSGGETPGGGTTGSGGSGVGGQTATGGVVATGGSAVGGSSTGGSGVGGKATGGSGAGGRASGGSGAGGKATGGTATGGAGGKASGGAPGTGGVTPTGGSAGHASGGGGGGGSAGAGGSSGPDCATLAKQYDAELQKNAKNCTTNNAGACALKMPQDLTCMNSCITWVEDSSGRLQKIYTSWTDAGCNRKAAICSMLVACPTPKGATCVANLTTTSSTAAAPAIGLPGTCQDDNAVSTQ